MFVFPVGDIKSLWLGLRADARRVLEHVVGAATSQKLEQCIHETVLGKIKHRTMYHCALYQEMLSHARRTDPRFLTQLALNFNDLLPQWLKSRMSHISQDAAHFNNPSNQPIYQKQNNSKDLFFKELRPLLMSLATTFDRSQFPMCPTCNTKEFMVPRGEQTRSGDEAETLFPYCIKCHTLFKDCVLN